MADFTGIGTPAIAANIRAVRAGGVLMTQHERLVSLCEQLKLQAVAASYPDLANMAASSEASFFSITWKKC
jgi:hypothetical protein